MSFSEREATVREFCLIDVVGRMCVSSPSPHKRCPRLNSWDLRICYLKWLKGLCSFGMIKIRMLKWEGLPIVKEKTGFLRQRPYLSLLLSSTHWFFFF